MAVTLKPPNHPLRASLSRANATTRAPDRALRLRPWLGGGLPWQSNRQQRRESACVPKG